LSPAGDSCRSSEPVRKCGSASSLDSGIVSPSTDPGELRRKKTAPSFSQHIGFF
jgi:hypothetical protein